MKPDALPVFLPHWPVFQTRRSTEVLRAFVSLPSRGLVLAAWMACAVLLFAGAAQSAPAKKLIEYGWDVPTPAQMRDELVAMEKRPFDGLIFRLGGGHNAFVTKPLEPAKFADDERILRALEFYSVSGIISY